MPVCRLRLANHDVELPARPFLHRNATGANAISNDKIKVRMENGQTLEVIVLSKRGSGIQIVLGEGIHSVRCELSPTRNGLAFAGSIMGREIVYERSVKQVQDEIDMLNPALRRPR